MCLFRRSLRVSPNPSGSLTPGPSRLFVGKNRGFLVWEHVKHCSVQDLLPVAVECISVLARDVPIWTYSSVNVCQCLSMSLHVKSQVMAVEPAGFGLEFQSSWKESRCKFRSGGVRLKITKHKGESVQEQGTNSMILWQAHESGEGWEERDFHCIVKSSSN